jgi:hypothetical protein
MSLQLLSTIFYADEDNSGMPFSLSKTLIKQQQKDGSYWKRKR